MKVDYAKLRKAFEAELESLVPPQWRAPIVQKLIEKVKQSEVQ